MNQKLPHQLLAQKVVFALRGNSVYKAMKVTQVYAVVASALGFETYDAFLLEGKSWTNANATFRARLHAHLSDPDLRQFMLESLE